MCCAVAGLPVAVSVWKFMETLKRIVKEKYLQVSCIMMPDLIKAPCIHEIAAAAVAGLNAVQLLSFV